MRGSTGEDVRAQVALIFVESRLWHRSLVGLVATICYEKDRAREKCYLYQEEVSLSSRKQKTRESVLE